MYKIIVSEITTTSQLQDPVSISDVPILCLTSRPTWREFCLLIFFAYLFEAGPQENAHMDAGLIGLLAFKCLNGDLGVTCHVSQVLLSASCNEKML